MSLLALIPPRLRVSMSKMLCYTPCHHAPTEDSPISPDHIAAAEALLDLEFTRAQRFDADTALRGKRLADESAN